MEQNEKCFLCGEGRCSTVRYEKKVCGLCEKLPDLGSLMALRHEKIVREKLSH